MAESAKPKVKADHSKRFLLKGGRYDAHRSKKKNSGFRLRVYPTYPRWDGAAFTPAMFENTVEYDGETYGFPETQNESEPFLEFLR